MFGMALWLLGVGCSGPNPETLIDELRVVAMVAEPPVVLPGEPATVEIFVADPEDKGAGVFAWTCTNFGDGCLEAAGGAQSVATREVVDGRVTLPLAPSPALAPIVLEDPQSPIDATAIWALACAGGADCHLVDGHPASKDRGEKPWGDDLACQLEDPVEWMSGLSMTGTSLAYRILSVSGQLPDERHANPTLTLETELPLEWKPEAEFELTFSVDGQLNDEARIFNYITGGGFTMPDSLVSTGEIVLKGVASEEAGPVQLWVVLNDGLGGVAVWTGEANVD
jgi:hypothetical protein